MIDPKPFVECEPIENALILVHEKDFLAYANKGENASNRFVNYEYHPDAEKNQTLAHHYYVIDFQSKHIFGFVELNVSAEEYARIQDEYDDKNS